MNQTWFCWSEWEKSWTLGAFFYGYILLQIVGGSLAEKYGTKLVLGMAVLLTSILTFCIPLGAKKDFCILFAIRFLQGVVAAKAILCRTEDCPPNVKEEEQMKEKDNRVKMMNEILQGIKVIKKLI